MLSAYHTFDFLATNQNKQSMKMFVEWVCIDFVPYFLTLAFMRSLMKQKTVKKIAEFKAYSEDSDLIVNES